MKNRKCKILVLADLKEALDSTLKSSVSLAKMIDGEITLFCVKKPADVVKKDNQLSAIREINHEYTAANRVIKNLVKTISKEFKTDINHSFSVGNLKSEVTNTIAEYKPDVIVIGKRKSKLLNLTGDKLTDFILKQHSGPVMITDDTNSIQPENLLNLGVFNGIEQAQNNAFGLQLLKNTDKPFKSFTIVNSTNTDNHSQPSINDEIVEFVFEQNDDSVKTLSNYLLKNNINLLYVNRSKQDITELINKLNVSLFLSET